MKGSLADHGHAAGLVNVQSVLKTLSTGKRWDDAIMQSFGGHAPALATRTKREVIVALVADALVVVEQHGQ